MTLGLTAFGQNSPASASQITTVSPSSSQSQQQLPSSPDASQLPTPGQQQPVSTEQDGMFVFRKQIEEVVLHGTVVDDRDRLVTHLDRNAFSVFENGRPQTITSFRREDVPVALGIAVDNSGSMRDKRDQVNRAVMNLIRASNPDDQIFVVNFSQDPYLDQDLTSDVASLERALHQTAMRGTTALYDAVVASDAHLKNYSRLDKKVLLVITDGRDNMSRETLQEALHDLQQRNGPVVYAIGLMGNGPQNPSRDALQRLADVTGGAAFFPADVSEVANITQTLARDIRSQYTLAYKPQDQNAPGYHAVRVEAHAPGYGHLFVRTKSGYYAGESVK